MRDALMGMVLYGDSFVCVVVRNIFHNLIGRQGPSHLVVAEQEDAGGTVVLVVSDADVVGPRFDNVVFGLRDFDIIAAVCSASSKSRGQDSCVIFFVHVIDVIHIIDIVDVCFVFSSPSHVRAVDVQVLHLAHCSLLVDILYLLQCVSIRLHILIDVCGQPAICVDSTTLLFHYLFLGIFHGECVRSLQRRYISRNQELFFWIEKLFLHTRVARFPLPSLTTSHQLISSSHKLFRRQYSLLVKMGRRQDGSEIICHIL
mmetsp:Transcript_20729/g.29195  ORF Transcript_20729/g.29195 Transcript_20729/m.29195 type:complete len:258 (+) Transcript_20729:583-1356(+)